MSTEASVDAEMIEAIKDVRSDTNDVKYVICGHVDGNPNHLGLISTGTDTAELASKMEPSDNLYVLGRYETVFDMSTVIKFVYFIWQGEKVSFVKRGRYGVVSGSIEKYFEPYHIQVMTSSTEEIGNEYVLQKLMETSGTKSKVLQDNVDSGGKQFQMRGFTQTQLPQREAKKSFGVSAVATKGADVSVSPEVYEAVQKVLQDSEAETWMVAGYDNANPAGPITCMGSGCGRLQELKDCLTENIPMYGFYRVMHTDQNEITSVKFIFISWMGPKVKPTVKAKISTHKGMVSEIFVPCHVSIYATDLSEIDEDDIMSQIDKQAAH